MQEKDPQHDNAETIEDSDDVGGRHRTPVFEEDRRRDENTSGEEDVVDGRDDCGVEDVEGFVEEVHLDGDEDNHEKDQDPC